ncbi:MAG: 50S ribosomal protein L32 [bacterium]|nr:50S ribosomal protein L32 [bacterium]
MGLPGHRRTSSHKRRRAAHFALSASTLAKCGHCGKAIKPHHACDFCGYYKGREVIKKEIKLKKK